jgi:hypothetical protein
MNEQLEEAEQVVREIRNMIDSLPPYDRMGVYLIADNIRSQVSMHGDKGMLAMSLIGAELQLQAAEQEWAEHERTRLMEQELQEADNG